MKLPFKLPPLFQKKEEKDYFLSLLLHDEKISAVIVEESMGRIHIVGHDEEYFSDTLENASEEELLDVADKAISKAEEPLEGKVETQKTIFGLKDSWVHETQIKKERLPLLKKITDALGLMPIGFLVITEAISHLLEKEEGAPVSAILLDVNTKQIQISLLRAGRVIETKSSPLDGSVIESTDKLLHHFVSHEILPSRLIIHADENAENLSQEFIGHTWSRNLPFLHVPQISTLPASFDAKAVLFGAATQMGFEVAHFDTPHPTKSVMPKLDVIPEKEKITEKEIDIENEEVLEDKTTDHNLQATDQENKTLEELSEENENPPAKADTKDAEFGFVSGSDVALSKSSSTTASSISEKKKTEEPSIEAFMPRHSDSIHIPNMPRGGSGSVAQTILGVLLGIIPLIVGVVGKAFGSVTRRGISLPAFSIGTGSKLIFLPPVLVLLLIGLVLFYVFGRSAQITLILSPKTVEQTEEITFASDKPTDNAGRIIAAEPVSVSEDGSATAPATGTKEVGEKAKGNVTIYSINTTPKTFPAGTSITGPNNLVFTFDSSVNVASASGNPITGIQPSTAKVSVTAKDIGKEYNLPSNTTFTLDSATSAKNDSAFSGGSKQEVTVVSKADVDKLTKQLPQDLSEKARNDLMQKSGGGTEVLPIFSGTTFTKKQLSKEIGQEASSVTLTATVSFSTMSYEKQALMSLVKETITAQAQNMNIPEDGLSYQVGEVKNTKSEKEVLAIVSMKGALIPLFDTNKLTNDIQGKSVADAERILRSLPQVSAVKIQISPAIPLFPKNLPSNTKKLFLTIHH